MAISPLQSFQCFTSLPTEIRLRIWQLAAPRRPRVVQVAFDQEMQCWRAWKDRVGSLPAIVPVSREARDEALKSYTRIFDAYVDLKHDTIFVSDPLFTIRSPRRVFMDSEDAKSLKTLALTTEIYEGLAQSSEQFPGLCDEPFTIMRKLDGLTHFTLVLTEDGASFEYDSDDESDLEGSEGDDDAGENDEVEGNAGDEGDENAENNSDVLLSQPSDTEDFEDEGAPDSRGHGPDICRFLEHLEEEATESMSKGYFKQPGNIHFESAVEHPDWWEGWYHYKGELEHLFGQVKDAHPQWIRPKVSIMSVEYGLNCLGDFKRYIHLLGDHDDDVLERNMYGDTSDFETDSDVESIATLA